MTPVLVLCLGNPLRRDDAVALHVADALERSAREGIEVRRSARAGLYLLDDMEGFERVVVVDAIRTAGGIPGTIHSLPLEAIHSPGGPSPHAIGLPSAIAAARAAGAPVPAHLHVVAIEVAEMEEIGEGLTPAVEGAIPRAVNAVRAAAARLRRAEVYSRLP
ncbi:MAG TPA: hydrogenase maturation protease [Anaeromyxobacteraceae bacterium]|nr:hydrogenase maturation protease [Anaeromyxobacteraceae bacterium]